MKFELKTENENYSKSISYFLGLVFIFSLITILGDVAIKLGIISSNTFHNWEIPRKTSEGIVVIKAIGIKILKNILSENENEFKGNLPI